MSMAEPVPANAPGICPLCGAGTPSDLERCPSCGFALAGVDGRPPAFSRATLLWTSMGFLAFYLITLAIVVATR
jgi:predicted amidophosphoribosyltransferase